MNVAFAGQYKTLPGRGGEGGRSDLVFDLSDKHIGHAAIHPWHLSGLFLWADDYYRDNHEIVPTESKALFDGYTRYVSEEE